MTGILLINKPYGITSHSVVSRVRRILNTRKVGHAGTLDPIATGVLVVLVGKATKLSDILLSETKRYEAGFELGKVTDTYDITGEVLSETECNISDSEIDSAILDFMGCIEQVPPAYSAIKKDGRKLYEYARAGIEVEIKPRQVEIFDIVRSGNTLDITCSKGTYIRSLIHDLGQKLGCGACMTALNRTASGQFGLEDCCTLEELEAEGFEKCALTIDDVLKVPDLVLSGDDERKMINGNYISAGDIVPGFYKVKTAGGDIICYGKCDGQKLRPEIMLW